MVCQFLLYNKVNQLHIYTRSQISSLPHLPPSHPPHPTPARRSQSTELISLCYVAASHQLSILHLVVYVCPCHSLTLSHLTPPPPHILKSILQQVCVFIPIWWLLQCFFCLFVLFCFLMSFRYQTSLNWKHMFLSYRIFSDQYVFKFSYIVTIFFTHCSLHSELPSEMFQSSYYLSLEIALAHVF